MLKRNLYFWRCYLICHCLDKTWQNIKCYYFDLFFLTQAQLKINITNNIFLYLCLGKKGSVLLLLNIITYYSINLLNLTPFVFSNENKNTRYWVTWVMSQVPYPTPSLMFTWRLTLKNLCNTPYGSKCCEEGRRATGFPPVPFVSGEEAARGALCPFLRLYLFIQKCPEVQQSWGLLF